jgi:predicted ATP-grasp superfamily ATP-dependent carboligase
LKQLAYTGVSEIEYKLDEASGRYALIEINPRHWDQHGLGAAVGVNLSETMYADLCGGHCMQSSQRPESVCWIAEDGLLLSLRSNIKHRAYRWSLYLDILRKPKTLAIMRWRDPKPALSLLFFGVADAAAGLLRSLARLVGLRKRVES